MSGIVGHIVRRGVDAASRLRQAENNLQDFKLSPQATAALLATFFSMLAILFSIRYTYGEVVGTLATIETPTATVVTHAEAADPDAPLLSEDSKTESKDEVVADLMVIKNKPITAKLITTIRHLRARAGIWSRFRGLSCWLVYHWAAFHLSNFTADLVGGRRHGVISQSIGAITAIVALGSVNMAWTHIVISDPSTKMWFRRIPNGKAWLAVAPATLLYAFAEQLTILVPITAFFSSSLPKAAQHGPDYIRQLNCADHKKMIVQSFVVIASGILTAFFVLVPASVTLTRVQASMLPEEYETVVPFDRSFGGKVVPAIVGGSGKIGLLDAWKTFNWGARVRLLKVYFKVAMMQLAVMIGFLGIFAAEMRFILGDRYNDVVVVAKAYLRS